GSGATGSAAIQLGKALGATVLATARGQGKAAYCKAQGADYAIDIVEDDLIEAVREITSGCGANVVYDTVGSDLYRQATKCVSKNGRIVIVGYAGGKWAPVDAYDLVVGNYSVI